MSPDEQPAEAPATPSQLRFRNHKGGEFRATGDDGFQYRLVRQPDMAWRAQEREHPSHGWLTIGANLSREQAEAVCGGRTPQLRAQHAAIKHLQNIVDLRQRAQARLEEADGWLQDALRKAFDAGLTAGPLVPITGLTRNRLYQIRDGRRT